ncbi:uncharacterized protein PAC_13558 [Phialocephala subalpina]|uniref:C2H2-type domain-containing protein n=1 Tax=Phialocephala subalpina TaxID=576137 RepID=A0A1L7XF56_9HELO|nr:uncharacterized protein PAC_13558 [Phialocephala subalpina]
MVTASKLSTRNGPRIACDHRFGCSKTFTRRYDMLRHKSEAHQPRKRCPYCKYDVPRQQRLRDHLREDHGSDSKEPTERTVDDLRRMEAECTQGPSASPLPSIPACSVSHAMGIASYPPHHPIQGHSPATTILYNDMDISSGLPSIPPSSYLGSGQWKEDINTTYPPMSHAQPTIGQGYSSQPMSSSSTFDCFAPHAPRHLYETWATSDSICGSAHHFHQVQSSIQSPGYGSGDMAHTQYPQGDNGPWGQGHSEVSGNPPQSSYDESFGPPPDASEGGHDSIWDKYLE